MDNGLQAVVDKADILTQALPYIRDFHNKIVVIKYGSRVLKDKDIAETVMKDVVLLKLIGMKPVIVHSGSDEINKWLNITGKNIEYKNDNRVTDNETMEIVEMVLGKINKDIVQMIEKNGCKAVGICGKDSGMIKVNKKLVEGYDIGYFGEIKEIDTSLIYDLLDRDFIPVISSIGISDDFESYNLKADDVAGAVAKALKAEKILFLAREDGVVYPNSVPKSMITVEEAKKIINKSKLDTATLNKLKCAVDALENGVHRVHIVDGSVEHSILLEFFTVLGIGTAIVNDSNELYPHEKAFR
ncbi:MAG: acetylglutamate kinase [Lachnospirales bacterium]